MKEEEEIRTANELFKAAQRLSCNQFVRLLSRMYGRMQTRMDEDDIAAGAKHLIELEEEEREWRLSVVEVVDAEEYVDE